MSSERQLPPEICDIILDHLHSDMESLSSCALVCKAWVPTARMHRFETLHIPRSGRGRSALALLCDSTSTILPYIRHLSLQEGGEGWRRNDPLWLGDALPRMRLQELSSLHSLRIQSFAWPTLSPQARACLLSVLPRVRSLSLPVLEGECVFGVFEMISAATSLHELSLLGMGVIDTPDSQSLLAQFPTSPFSRTLTRLQVDAASIFLRFINWVAPGLPVPEIDLQDFFSSTEATKFIASCGSRVKHLTLRFSDLGWANPEGIFIFYGGLSHNSSLITLDLGCEHASIIPILHQLPSPHLSMSVVTLHMTPDTLLRFDSNLGALEDLFTSHFPAARLEIIGTHDDVEPLLGLRDGLFARMRRLREEGRLGFKRSDGLSMDPDTPSVMDSLLEDQGTVH